MKSRICTSASALMLMLAVAMDAPAQAPAEPVDRPPDRSTAEAYSIDPVHTRVLFGISHAGYSQALGAVSGSTGVLLFDEDDWRSARLEVTVPLARLDLGDGDWNAAAMAGNLLDVASFPEAHFVSSRVEPVDGTHATICGDLTLHGQTRPLCMDVTVNQVKRYPLPPFRHTAGFSAIASLSRADFGIDAWKSVIGDTVELRIEAEARRDDDARDRFSAPDPALESSTKTLLPVDATAPETLVPEVPALTTPATEPPAPEPRGSDAPEIEAENKLPTRMDPPQTSDGAVAPELRAGSDTMGSRL